MGVLRFEELKSWMVARELTTIIYRTFNQKRDYGFWNQITRSAVSVMNNISEGFECGNEREFIRYLRYSKASCGEVRNMVYIAFDIGYLDREKHLLLLDKCRLASGAIYGMVRYLEEKQSKSSHYEKEENRKTARRKSF